MAQVPIPTSSTPGPTPGQGDGRLINAAPTKEGDTLYWRRTPGLTATGAVISGSGPRGMLPIGQVLFNAYADAAHRVNADNSELSLGSLPGAGGVTWARNNRTAGGVSTPDVVAVREEGGAYYVAPGSNVIAAYPDADLPATVNSVDFIGGYLMFSNPDGRMFASELNSTDINPLSFATAEAKADGLLRGVVYSNRYYAMGSSTIEIWSNEGDTPFPLRRAATVIQTGLLTTMAVAGFEEGWNEALGFVASDGTVRLLSGFQAQTISTPAVERFISTSDKATIECYVCTSRGHSIFGISSNVGTWEYDISQPHWHELQSTGLPRWRASRGVKRGADWVFGDRLAGAILKLDPDASAEAGAALPWIVETGPLKQYPARVAIPAAYADFARADASVLIEYSHDGGATWLGQRVRSLASAGKVPVEIRRIGISTQHGLRMRFTVTDPVPVSLMSVSVPDPAVRGN